MVVSSSVPCFIAPSPSARALKPNYQAMTRFVQLVLKKRLLVGPTSQKEKASSGRPSDFIQWMLDASQNELCTLERQCQLLLDIATDASFATSLSLTHISFDLATYPEYIQPLREEFTEKIARSQDITRATLSSIAS